MARYGVDRVDTIRLEGPEALTSCQLMSPFVWQPSAGGKRLMLVRAVAQDHAQTGKGISGTIWLAAEQEDALTFLADDEPLIVPGPGLLDCMGCEDPTVVPTDEGCIVYYTGLDPNGAAQMLYAEGADIRGIVKQGIAYASTNTESNTKEATVDRTQDGEWRLLFEYSRDNRSRIGIADGNGPAGYWTEHDDPLTAREDKWDCWHLSTGPLLVDEPGGPLFFYNGSDKDAHWGIGWAILHPDCLTVAERCDDPLIGPPPANGDGVEISFAASAVRDGDAIWLYYSTDDRRLNRAIVRRLGDE